jgi:hypothetical protein
MRRADSCARRTRCEGHEAEECEAELLRAANSKVIRACLQGALATELAARRGGVLAGERVLTGLLQLARQSGRGAWAFGPCPRALTACSLPRTLCVKCSHAATKEKMPKAMRKSARETEPQGTSASTSSKRLSLGPCSSSDGLSSQLRASWKVWRGGLLVWRAAWVLDAGAESMQAKQLARSHERSRQAHGCVASCAMGTAHRHIVVVVAGQALISRARPQCHRGLALPCSLSSASAHIHWPQIVPYELLVYGTRACKRPPR